MTRDLAAPTSPSFSLRTSMSQVQGFCFAPEALPGTRSMLKPPGQDRAGPRLSPASETAIECSQLVGGEECSGARRPRKYKYLVQCTPHIHRRYSGKSRIFSGLARVQEFSDGLHRYNSPEPSGTPSLLPIISPGRAAEELQGVTCGDGLLCASCSCSRSSASWRVGPQDPREKRNTSQISIYILRSSALAM